jgi:hypothetical protein
MATVKGPKPSVAGVSKDEWCLPEKVSPMQERASPVVPRLPSHAPRKLSFFLVSISMNFCKVHSDDRTVCRKAGKP